MFGLAIAFILSWIASSADLQSQAVCNDPKGISTHAGSATNSEFPQKKNSSPVIFDWRDTYMTIYSSLTNADNMVSPFFQSNNEDYMQNL
jgi:hypothetical protein